MYVHSQPTDYLKQLRDGRRSFIQTVVKWGPFPYLGKMPTGENKNFAWTRTAQLAAKHARVFCTKEHWIVSPKEKCPRLPHKPEHNIRCENLDPFLWKEKKKPKQIKCRLICSGNNLNPVVKDLTASSCLLVKPAARLCTGAGLSASTADGRTGAWIYSSLAELTAELKLSATIFKLITHGHSNPIHVIAIAAFRH